MPKRQSTPLSEMLAKKLVRGGEFLTGVAASAATFGFTGNEPLAAAAGYVTEHAMHRADNYLFGFDQETDNLLYISNRTKPTYKKKLISRKRRPTRRKAVIYRSPKKEIKMFDLSSNQQINPAGNWSFTSLGPFPIMGTDMYNRIGRRINVLSINVRCWLIIQYPAQVPTYGVSIRCLIIRDNETKGAVVAQNDLFETRLIAPPVMSNPYNSVNKNRFTILHQRDHDVVVTGTNAGVTTSVNNHQIHNIFIKHHMPVNYQSNAGTVADIVDNSFTIACCASNPAVATTMGNMNFYSRVYYTDD